MCVHSDSCLQVVKVNIASVLYEQGKLQEALDMWTTALKPLEKGLGPEHLVVAATKEKYSRPLDSFSL